VSPNRRGVQSLGWADQLIMGASSFAVALLGLVVLGGGGGGGGGGVDACEFHCNFSLCGGPVHIVNHSFYIGFDLGQENLQVSKRD
jgi:hypothetical protein